ncbi:MAG: cyclic nucleotide-binding/CBS domain-containing protein [Myxococcota bacterium]
MEGDESYFDDEPRAPLTGFDKSLLREPLRTLRTRPPLVFSPAASVTEAMRDMQQERRGCVLITEDGTQGTRLVGIFTERDVLLRIVDRGRNPASLPLREVMTPDPEALPQEASIAWVLNKMAVGGFRHVPVIDDAGRPVLVVSVRDVVQFLVEFFPREVLNLPPEFGANRMKQREGA